MVPKMILAAALLVCLAPISARAELPDYDVEAECHRIAAFGGTFSESTMHECLEMEQSAYNALKPRWDALPSNTRAECDRIARFGGAGSFSTLQECVDMELDAARTNREFKFQR